MQEHHKFKVTLGLDTKTRGKMATVDKKRQYPGRPTSLTLHLYQRLSMNRNYYKWKRIAVERG